MICRAGLRGRAPFSCGKKRALPLKLPLPPKTAHGKARSTRLPSFRTKKHKEGKRQQKCRPQGVRHTGPASSLPTGTACQTMLCVPETASQASYTAIGPARCSGTTIFKERKRTWEEGFGLREKNSACPAGLCFLFPSRQRTGPDKVFWRGGGARGGGRTFCSQKGGLPLAPILSAYCGRSSTRREMASATWAGAMASLPSRSAMVRARRSTRV